MKSPLIPVAEWIAGGDGFKGPWGRFVVVVAAFFLWIFASNWKNGAIVSWWWVTPTIISACLFVPFCLWRLTEHRRRLKHRRTQSERPLDLEPGASV